ncbi:MAG: hypothetical protein ACTHJM_15965 [Marmoricola sp.]
MAVSQIPFALQNGSHSAALFRQAVSSVVPNGGGLVQTGDLAVTQTGTPSMAVVVGVGRAWVPGTNVANFSGTTYSAQAQYFALNDANVTLTIAAADPTNPRIDIVCLTVNDSQYTGSTNNAALQVITGTPAPTPAAPAAPANTLVLAQVSVAANAPSIINANISAPTTPLHAINPSYGNGTAYTPIWTGATNFGSGGSMSGTYWLRGDMVTVRAKVVSGTGASLGTGVIAFPLPANLPLLSGQLVLGTGAFQTSGGVIRTLTCYAASSTTCSVWAPTTPISTPGSAGYPFAAGDSIEALITYQTNPA